jgi:hypothetical protein
MIKREKRRVIEPAQTGPDNIKKRFKNALYLYELDLSGLALIITIDLLYGHITGTETESSATKKLLPSEE